MPAHFSATSTPTRIAGVVALVLLAACREPAGDPAGALPRPVPAAAAAAAAPERPPDFADILDHARRASAIYEGETAMRGVIGLRPRLTVADLRGVDVRASVEVDEALQRQWVVVRGTANLANAVEDAEYAKVQALDLGVPVHQGFLEDAHEVWSFARPLLKPGLETRLTGHSLGGAVAVVLAMRLRRDGVPVERVVTFGQPKVTTGAGVARFRDLSLLRVVNHDDPVPLLPWETPGAVRGGLFRHLGEEVRLTDIGTWQLFPEHRAEGYLLTSFATHLGRENPKEHEMARYLARLVAVAAPLDAPTGDAR